MREHHLKTDSEYFQAIKAGLKPFEVRYNDRDFQVGDTLVLEEISEGVLCADTYTGQVERREITYILGDPQYCKPGYVILGLKSNNYKLVQAAFEGETQVSEAVLDILSDRTELEAWLKRASWHCKKLDEIKTENDALWGLVNDKDVEIARLTEVVEALKRVIACL